MSFNLPTLDRCSNSSLLDFYWNSKVMSGGVTLSDGEDLSLLSFCFPIFSQFFFSVGSSFFFVKLV